MDTSLNPQKLNSSTKKPLVNKGRLVKINSSNISSVRPSSQTTADEQLWLKLFEPTTKDTLAIHSKKIKEVEDKLRSCLIQTKKCRIILCTGPCGCGKSICIRLIASSLDANIIDWETSTTSTLTTTIEDKDRTKDWESQKLLFRSFLFQSTRYLSSSVGNSLLFESDIQKNLRTNEQLPKTSHKYQIVLIEV
ncbi:unnamed protein product [Didymodactylos carnosus]|uniref:Cell cycle checkpoint protein RAD17 n=1 Tax=Didymodactylos carnosus TaxID=1234261 RepID=A0A814GSP3_9BILA|nr:unnamed protein product [Didymodactylos carnosus]CAF3772013.1 unnamed protein product [Didymodactylos carnosus]